LALLLREAADAVEPQPVTPEPESEKFDLEELLKESAE
jgi:hypothetical protein